MNLVSCGKGDDTNNNDQQNPDIEEAFKVKIKQLSAFPEKNVVSAFTINGKGYAITESSNLYEYNPSNDSWTAKADFPSDDRSFAYGYSIGNLGYFGFGFTSGNVKAEDLWVYNAANNSWKELAITNEIDVLGIYSPYATAMLIGDVIYAGNGASKKMYAGTVNSDISIDWEEESTFPINDGEVPSTALYFSINGTGYWGGYYLGNNVSSTKFYTYTPGTNTWAPLNDLPDQLSRYFQSYTFTIGSYAYTFNQGQIWKYDPLTDSWLSIVSEDPMYYFETSFTIDNTAYLLFTDGTVYSFKEE